MKRRFVECAVLLGIVMSVMFLAQTQDVISHTQHELNEDGSPKKDAIGQTIVDVTHTDDNHDRCRKGIKGVLKGDSGTCGGAYSTWAWSSNGYGGKIEGTSPKNPSISADDCQMIFVLKIYVDAYAGANSCRGSVTPSIPEGLVALKIGSTGFQGDASIDLSFSAVNYHSLDWHHAGRFGWSRFSCYRCGEGHCKEHHLKKNVKKIDTELVIEVVETDFKKGTHKTIDAKITVGDGDDTVVATEVGASRTTYSEESTSDYRVRPHKVSLEYGDPGRSGKPKPRGNSVVEKRDKSATASGTLRSNLSVSTSANRPGNDTHDCSSYPSCRAGECPL